MKRGIPGLREALLRKLLFTAVVPLLLVFSVSLVLWGHFLRKNALEDCRQVTSNMAEQIRNRLHSTEASMLVLDEALVRLRGLPGFEFAAVEVLDAVVSQSPQFETVMELGPDLRVRRIGLSSALRPRREDFLGLDLSCVLQFEIALRERRASWSDSTFSLITGRGSLVYCMPHGDGLLVACSTLRTVEDFVPTRVDEKSYRTLLVDTQGCVLLDDTGRFPLRVIHLDKEPLIAAALAGRTGDGSLRWEGQDCLGSTQQVARTGWVAIGFARQAVALRPLHLLVWVSVVGIALSVGFAWALSVAMSRRLSLPLDHLSAQAARIARGDYGTAMPTQAYAELEQVAESLGQMALAVQDRERRLHELASSIAAAAGDDCHRQVVESCRRLLGADLVFVAHAEKEGVLNCLACHPPEMAAVVAKLQTDAEPFASTFSLRFRHVPQGLVPGLLRGVEPGPDYHGYLGVCLCDVTGRVRGLLCAFFRGPFTLPSQAEESMRILAFRAASELQRQEAERRQKATEAELLQAQKLEALGRLVGGIAHDFNNMLQGIRGFTEMAQQDLTPGHKVQEHLTEVRNASGRAAELVQQLLIFSRRDNPVPRHMDLNTVFPTLLRMLRRVIGEQVLIDFTQANRPCWVLVDRTQFEQIVMNLAVNARDAMPKGGRLSFALRPVRVEAGERAPSAEWVEMLVADTGVGMSAEVQAKIFDPFFTTKDIGRGTGLGLATVYGIMQQVGGSVHVQSHLGHGTTFRLQFPLLHPRADFTVEQPAAIAQPVDKVQTLGPVTTVLVAEDDVIVRSLVGSVLRTEGYETLIAADGMQAIELFDRHEAQIDLVILDVIMPRKSGREVAEHVWQRKPRMPVLFTSGYFADSIDAASLPAGQGEILRKPYGRDEFVSRVRRLLLARRPDAG